MLQTLNFNIGMLGHVDSGKTSLCKALSSVSSTAAFDKNPQSKQRGITLDLGFSSFTVPAPSNLLSDTVSNIQYTLVDCPGHASLIRTVIGGAQIIDLMILVIDIMKGMQTQTAECLVIGEIICENLLVVLNKIDLVPADKQQTHIKKMTKKVCKTLERTKFSGCEVIPVSAGPGNLDKDSDTRAGMNIGALVESIKKHTHIPKRSDAGPFIFSVDHCFSIKGQGTIMTGTVLSGKLSVNDSIEVPSLQEVKKVKSIQMFRKPFDFIVQGDRAGICVTQFEPKHLERGLVCAPGVLPTLHAALARISKIPYYAGEITSRSKFHITIGHSTVMASLKLFAHASTQHGESNLKQDWVLQKEGGESFDYSKEYLYLEKLEGENIHDAFALLEFEKTVTCRRNSLAIGSRLDSAVTSNQCRLAFQANIIEAITVRNYAKDILPKVKVYKEKSKDGVVDRIQDDYTVLCRGLMKKESNIEYFQGLGVVLSTGEQGSIEGAFGQNGKLRIRIPGGVSENCKVFLGVKDIKNQRRRKHGQRDDDNSSSTQFERSNVLVSMSFKRYIFDPEKKMVQT